MRNFFQDFRFVPDGATSLRPGERPDGVLARGRIPEPPQIMPLYVFGETFPF